MKEGWRYVRSAAIGLSPIPRGFLLDGSSPTKVPEYLSLGLPVVCNDNPDQQAIVESTRCGLCVSYTGLDFARAVVSLARQSEENLRQMSERGRAYALGFRSYHRIAQSVASAYSKVIG